MDSAKLCEHRERGERKGNCLNKCNFEIYLRENNFAFTCESLLSSLSLVPKTEVDEMVSFTVFGVSVARVFACAIEVCGPACLSLPQKFMVRYAVSSRSFARIIV